MLIFCEELNITEEEYGGNVEDPKLLKKSSEFELDITRIQSIGKLKELFDNSGLLKTYKASELSKGFIYAGTKFEFKAVKKNLFIIIEINKNGKGHITILGDKDQFIESTFRNMLDIIRK